MKKNKRIKETNTQQLDNLQNNTQTNRPKSKTRMKVLLGTLSGIAIGGLIAGIGVGFSLHPINENSKTQTVQQSVYPSSIKNSDLVLSVQNNDTIASTNNTIAPILTLNDTSIPSNAKNITYYWYFNADNNASLNQLTKSELNNRSSSFGNNAIILYNQTSNAGYYCGAISYEINNVVHTYYSNSIKINIDSSINDLNLFNGNNSLTSSIYKINGNNNIGTSSNPKTITLTSNFNWKNNTIPSTKDGDSITYELYSTTSTSINLNDAVLVSSQKSNVFTINNPFSNMNYFVVTNVSYNDNTYNNVSTSNLVTITYSNSNQTLANPTNSQKPSITSNAINVYYNSTLKNNPSTTINLYNPLNYSVSISFTSNNSNLASFLNDNSSNIAVVSNNSIILNLSSINFTTYNNDSFNVLVSFSYSQIINGNSTQTTYSTLTSKAITLINITAPITLISNTTNYDYASNITSDVYFNANLNEGMNYLGSSISLNNITWYYSTNSDLSNPIKLDTTSVYNYTLSGISFNTNTIYVYAVVSLNYNNTNYSYTTNNIQINIANKQTASNGGLSISVPTANYVLNDKTNFSATIKNTNNITLTSSNFSITNVSLPTSLIAVLNKSFSYNNGTLTFDTNTILSSLPSSFTNGQFIINLSATYENNNVSTNSVIITLYNLTAPTITANNLTESANNDFNVLFSNSTTLPTSYLTNTYATILTNSNKTDLQNLTSSYDFNNLINDTYVISNNSILNNKITTTGSLYYVVLVVYALTINNKTYYIDATSNIASINVINTNTIPNPSATLSSGPSDIIYAQGINSVGSNGNLTKTIFSLDVNSAWTLKDSNLVSNNSNLSINDLKSIVSIANNTLTFNWNDLTSSFFDTYNGSNFFYQLTYTNTNNTSYTLTLPVSFSINYVVPIMINTSTSTLSINKTTQTGGSLKINSIINSLIDTNTQNAIQTNALISFSNDGTSVSLPYSDLSNIDFFTNNNLKNFLDFNNTSSVSLKISIILNSQTISNVLSLTLIDESTTSITPTITFGQNFTNTLYYINSQNLYLNTGNAYTQTNNTSLNLDATITNSSLNNATSYISGLSYDLVSSDLKSDVISSLNTLLNKSLPTSYASYSQTNTINTSINLLNDASFLSNITSCTFYLKITATITNISANNTTTTTSQVFYTPLINFYNLNKSINISNTTITKDTASTIAYTSSLSTLPQATLKNVQVFTNTTNSFNYGTLIPTNTDSSITSTSTGTSYMVLGFIYEIVMSGVSYNVLVYSNSATLTTTNASIIETPSVNASSETLTYFKNDNTDASAPAYAVLNAPTIDINTGSYNYQNVSIAYYDGSKAVSGLSDFSTSYIDGTFTYVLSNSFLSNLLSKNISSFTLTFNFINPNNNNTISKTLTISLSQSTSSLLTIYTSTNTYNNTNLTIYSNRSQYLSNQGTYTWYYGTTNTAISNAGIIANNTYTINGVPSSTYFLNGEVSYYLVWTNGNIIIKSNIISITFPDQTISNPLTFNQSSSITQTLNDLSKSVTNGSPVGNINIVPTATSIYMQGNVSNLTLNYSIAKSISISNLSLTLNEVSAYSNSTLSSISSSLLQTLNTWLKTNFASSWYKISSNVLTIVIPSSFINQLSSNNANLNYLFNFNLSYNYLNAYGQDISNSITTPNLTSINPLGSYSILTNNIQTTTTQLTNTNVVYTTNSTLNDVALWTGASLTNAQISNKKLSAVNSNNTLSLPSNITTGDLFAVVGYKEFSIDGVSFQIIIVSNEAKITISQETITPPTIETNNGSVNVYSLGGYHLSDSGISQISDPPLSYGDLQVSVNNNEWTYQSATWTSTNTSASSILDNLTLSDYFSYDTTSNIFTINVSKMSYSVISSLNGLPLILILSFSNGSKTTTLKYDFSINLTNPLTVTSTPNNIIINSTTYNDNSFNMSYNTSSINKNITITNVSYGISPLLWTNTAQGLYNALENLNSGTNSVLLGTSSASSTSGSDSFAYSQISSITQAGTTGVYYLYVLIAYTISGNNNSFSTLASTKITITNDLANGNTNVAFNYSNASNTNNAYFLPFNSSGNYDIETNLSDLSINQADQGKSITTSQTLSGIITPGSNNITLDEVESITANGINGADVSSFQTYLNNNITGVIIASGNSFDLNDINCYEYNNTQFWGNNQQFIQFTLTFTFGYTTTPNGSIQIATYTTPVITLYNLNPSITFNSITLFANTTQTVNWTNSINLPNSSLYWNDFVVGSSLSTLSSNITTALSNIEEQGVSAGSYTFSTPLGEGQYYGIALAVYSLVIGSSNYYVLVYSSTPSTPNVQVLSELSDVSIYTTNQYVWEGGLSDDAMPAVYSANYISATPIGTSISDVSYNWGLAAEYTTTSGTTAYYDYPSALLKKENVSITAPYTKQTSFNNSVLFLNFISNDYYTKNISDFKSLINYAVPYVVVSAKYNDAIVSQKVYSNFPILEISAPSWINDFINDLSINNNTQTFNTNVPSTILPIWLSLNNKNQTDSASSITSQIATLNEQNRTQNHYKMIWQIDGISWAYTSINDYVTTLISNNIATTPSINTLQPSSDLLNNANTYSFYPMFALSITYRNHVYKVYYQLYNVNGNLSANLNVVNTSINTSYQFTNANNWFSTAPTLDQTINDRSLPIPVGGSYYALGWIWNYTNGFTKSFSDLGNMLGWGYIKNTSSSVLVPTFAYASYGTNPTSVSNFGTNFDINSLLTNATLQPTSIKNVTLSFNTALTGTVTFSDGNIFEDGKILSYSYTSSSYDYKQVWTYDDSSSSWTLSSNNWNNLMTNVTNTASNTMSNFASNWPTLQQQWNAWDINTAFNGTALQVSFAKPSSNPFSLVITLNNNQTINIPITFSTATNW